MSKFIALIVFISVLQNIAFSSDEACDRIPKIKKLLDSGAEVDAKTKGGMRALHFCVVLEKRDCVSCLLEHNSSLDDPDVDGNTPLHFACRYGRIQITSILLARGANLLLRNEEYKTSLDLACEFGQTRVVEILLKQKDAKFLLQNSPQDTVDKDRTTSIHLAAKNGHVDVIRLLLKAGIDINRSTLSGTALHEAVFYDQFEVVILLVHKGIDVNKVNSYGQTALDIAYSQQKSTAEKKLSDAFAESIWTSKKN